MPSTLAKTLPSKIWNTTDKVHFTMHVAYILHIKCLYNLWHAIYNKDTSKIDNFFWTLNHLWQKSNSITVELKGHMPFHNTQYRNLPLQTPGGPKSCPSSTHLGIFQYVYLNNPKISASTHGTPYKDMDGLSTLPYNYTLLSTITYMPRTSYQVESSSSIPYSCTFWSTRFAFPPLLWFIPLHI